MRNMGEGSCSTRVPAKAGTRSGLPLSREHNSRLARLSQPSKLFAEAATGSASPIPIVARGASASELVTG